MKKVGLLRKACITLLICAATAIAAPAQSFTTLFSFELTDGSGPSSGLIQAADGNFHGIATTGGTYGFGTVFKITPQGRLTTLYSFCAQTGCADGAYPHSGLIQAADGSFYGTTTAGGTSAACFK